MAIEDPMNDYEDPIVAEIRAIRREISEEFGNDIYALGKYLMKREQEHPERLVYGTPKAPKVVAPLSDQEKGS